MDIMTALFLGTPIWMWAGFMLIVLGLLAFDLGVLHKGSNEISVGQSLRLSALYIALGVGFGGLVWWQLGATPAVEYLTAFTVEKSLALDNIFVIALIFGALAIPRAFQHRVLFWGILGVIVLRALMIGVGATLVAEYHWLLYLFAAFLIATGIKMLVMGEAETDLQSNPLLKLIRRRFRLTEGLHGTAFLVRQTDTASGKTALYLTPLLVALVMIEAADIVFAVDSVPAVFAITTDPFIVYTSNIFAILGLRALYFALAAILHRFAYLKQALAILLVFIGAKIFVADAMGWDKFPALWSLSITFALLGGGVVYSLWRTRNGSETA